MIYRGCLWTSEVWDVGRITVFVQSCRCSGNAPRGHKQPCSTHVCVPFFPWLTVNDFFWWHQTPVISAFYQECYGQSGIPVIVFTKPKCLDKDTSTLWRVKCTSTHLKSYVLLSGWVCSAALSQIFYWQYWMRPPWGTFSIPEYFHRLAKMSLNPLND